VSTDRPVQLMPVIFGTAGTSTILNLLTPNDDYSGRTAPLASKCCILYIYSTNIGTENCKHGIYSPFFPLQNVVCFIYLTYLVPVLFTFYIQDVLKLKKNNSGAKILITEFLRCVSEKISMYPDISFIGESQQHVPSIWPLVSVYRTVICQGSTPSGPQHRSSSCKSEAFFSF